MTETLRTISPVDGRVYVERPYATETGIAGALAGAVRAQSAWKEVAVAERADGAGHRPASQFITWRDITRPRRRAGEGKEPVHRRA